mmetsp:Transcript_12709/g.12352  ORF Transcript_12709/g.12352 Transcript_12709/m.12352 type:complete len:247 (+) Transcript_12709:1290-2030(+)
MPSSTSHIWRFPFVAAAQISFPSGLKATARTSHPCSNVSIHVFLYTSHSLSVPSHDPDARVEEVRLKSKHAMGPSWPERISNNRPVCKDHTYISKGSNEPAHTISPLESTAKDINCTGVGVVSVRKFLYLNKSCALTVPSNEQLRTALPVPLPTNRIAVTGATCSEKVTKQNPEEAFHSFTLESSPPVAIYWPSEEKSNVVIPYKCPCCLSTYVSDCHSHTSNCPNLVEPKANHSPVLLIQAVFKL